MPLFADGFPAEQWIGPMITTLGASVAALFAWLTARDKLRYDVRLAKLEDAHDECERRHKELEAEVVRLRGESRQRGEC